MIVVNEVKDLKKKPVEKPVEEKSEKAEKKSK